MSGSSTRAASSSLCYQTVEKGQSANSPPRSLFPGRCDTAVYARRKMLSVSPRYARFSTSHASTLQETPRWTRMMVALVFRARRIFWDCRRGFFSSKREPSLFAGRIPLPTPAESQSPQSLFQVYPPDSANLFCSNQSELSCRRTARRRRDCLVLGWAACRL